MAKFILKQIKQQHSHRRNVDIERFMEMRVSPDYEELATRNLDKKEENNEYLVFGIEVLPNGEKKFKNYDKVLLKGKTPFHISLMGREQRSPNDNLFLAHYLYQNVKYFSSINLTLIAFISRKMSAVKFSMGDMIITKGEVGECMFIIYKGVVEVLKEGRTGAPILIEAGKVFGEQALINKEVRNASVAARTDVE